VIISLTDAGISLLDQGICVPEKITNALNIPDEDLSQLKSITDKILNRQQKYN